MKSVWSRFGGDRAGLTRRRRQAPARLGAEGLEPRTLLAVTVPPDITSHTVELDDDVLVGSDGGTIEATTGYVQIFGNSRGRIDRVADAIGADLAVIAQTSITVTGAIGAGAPFDSLTIESKAKHPVTLQQSVTLEDDLLVVRAGSFSIGSTVNVGGDLTITDAATVLFAGNVTVVGDLTITAATSVTFAGTLTVGGTLTIANATGTTRFAGDVIVGGASVTSTSLVQVQAGFTTDAGESAGPADVTFTTDQINLTTASLQPATGTGGATLTIRPRTVSRDLTIASPPGIPSGLTITDADIFAIQPGWKRVVFGDEAAGTGAVKVGSIGSQYGGFSQLLNPTTIVGGSIQVVQAVDATPLADTLELVARTGGITIDAPINQTTEERNDVVRLAAHGPLTVAAPVWADRAVSLSTTGGGTIAQQGTAPITAATLAVDADGAVTLTDAGNAFTTVAIVTTNDDISLREDSGFTIGVVGDVTGLAAGTATATLRSAGAVGQAAGSIVTAGALSLVGAGGSWTLPEGNRLGTLTADTGSLTVTDADGLTVGAITASQASGTAVDLAGPSGLVLSAPIVTKGGDAIFRHAVTLASDVAITAIAGAAVGTVDFRAAVDGTAAGMESLTITGGFAAGGAFGEKTPLESLAISSAPSVGSSPAPVQIAAGFVTATDIGAGGIHLEGIGDLRIGSGGITASGPVALAASGRISVLEGGAIVGTGVSSTQAIHWSVANTSDSGVGSLRQVLTAINAVGDSNPSGTDAVIVLEVMSPVAAPFETVIRLSSKLPDVAAAVTLDGTVAGLALDGGRAVSSALVYGGPASGSVLRGVTLRNFSGFGVQLVSARNVLIDTITVESLNTTTSMGLYASGDLAGTEILGSTFTGGLRGALLDGARNLTFGRLGASKGNSLSGNRSVPRQPKFAGTGIRAQGDCSDTVVEGNTFTGNNYGFAFMGARNLALRNNTFNRNSIAGIYIEGNCAGSTQSDNAFGTGSDRNKVNTRRAKRSKFG